MFANGEVSVSRGIVGLHQRAFLYYRDVWVEIGLGSALHEDASEP